MPDEAYEWYIEAIRTVELLENDRDDPAVEDAYQAAKQYISQYQMAHPYRDRGVDG
jgi:hypothetical protein